MEAAGSTVLWRLFRKGPTTTAFDSARENARLAQGEDHVHAVMLPGGPPHTLAFFANGELDRVENYETMDLALFRAEEIKRSLLAEDWATEGADEEGQGRRRLRTRRSTGGNE